MTTEITLRDETPADVVAITQVTLEAFKSLEISQHNEQLVVAALRQAGKLTVSLVAQVKAEVIGHIAFSPVTLSDGTPDWYGLGPVSVLPQYQRQGIGSVLIREGLARLKALNGAGCCLVGHPQYYTRFGFANTADLVLEGVPAEVFFALPFNRASPRGQVHFHPAFTAGL
ncbi:MAG: N-acetyltransferase [Comamonadaceae bacterium]|nr:N-acetyltransferase [Comamonadaceae bacterium]